MRKPMVVRVLDSIPKMLDGAFESDTCAPTFEEIEELAHVAGVRLRVVVVYELEKIVACAPCYLDVRRHHGLTCRMYGLYSGKLHDYQRVLVSSQEAGNLLRKGIIDDAKSLKADIVSIDSALISLEAFPCARRVSSVKIFDSKLEGGWQTLYKRKSVRRFENAARRVGEYRVEVFEGRLDDDLMDELAELHIRRWQFESAPSPFLFNVNRKDEYRCHPSNKHYLRVMLGDEILACHYGMIYGDTLLWHTPLINPKYLELSPLRILLAEEARYCEGEGLNKIDFGLGDEAYKEGYCHSARVTFAFLKHLTIRGWTAWFIGFAFRHGGCAVKELLRRLVWIARGLREKHLTTWIYYQSDPVVEVCDSRFVSVDNWHGFCDLASRCKFNLLKWQYERFRSDESVKFVALVENDEILSYGWTTEKNRDLLHGKKLDGVILYDFVTPENKRHCGFYTALLRHLRMTGGIICAASGNEFSNRAIRSAGYRQVLG